MAKRRKHGKGGANRPTRETPISSSSQPDEARQSEAYGFEIGPPVPHGSVGTYSDLDDYRRAAFSGQIAFFSAGSTRGEADSESDFEPGDSDEG